MSVCEPELFYVSVCAVLCVSGPVCVPWVVFGACMYVGVYVVVSRGGEMSPYA